MEADDLELRIAMVRGHATAATCSCGAGRCDERVHDIATAQGTIVEEFATKALEGDLAARWLEWSDATGRPGGGT